MTKENEDLIDLIDLIDRRKLENVDYDTIFLSFINHINNLDKRIIDLAEMNRQQSHDIAVIAVIMDKLNDTIKRR